MHEHDGRPIAEALDVEVVAGHRIASLEFRITIQFTRERTHGGKAAQTRTRLLGAGAEVIEEGGYAAASVTEIAGRAGVAAGTLYYHFGSKEELFVEVFRAAATRELRAMREAAAAPAPWPARLEAVIETFAGRALRSPRLAWALLYEPVDALVDAERLAFRRRYRAGMAGLLREGVDAGVIPPQDATLSAAGVVGAIAEALVGPLSARGARGGGRSRDEQTVAGIVRFCGRAIGLDDEEGER